MGQRDNKHSALDIEELHQKPRVTVPATLRSETMTNKQFRLGPVQIEVLRSMQDHKGVWCPRSNEWYWDTPSRTQKVMESLIPHGLVERLEAWKYLKTPRTEYHITAAGRDYLVQITTAEGATP